MKRYMLLCLLAGILSCFAMDDSGSDYCESELSRERTFTVKKRKKSTSLFYAVSPLDANEMLSNTRHQSMMAVLMWHFASETYKASSQFNDIEAVLCRQVPSEVFLGESVQIKASKKILSMRCPACPVIIQTSKEKNVLFISMYKHWFLGKVHQPLVYEQMKLLVGRTEQEARDCFNKYGLPTASIVPFPRQNIAKNTFKMGLQMIMQNDELIKVFDVQEGYAQRSLTCPVQDCSYLVGQNVEDGNVDAARAVLFQHITQHCYAVHPGFMRLITQQSHEEPQKNESIIDFELFAGIFEGNDELPEDDDL